MAREAIPTWFFVVTVVRESDRFLLVHERKHPGWYLPAGRVEPGERLVDAAVRETLEESGVEVRPTGVIRIEHSPGPSYTRVRAVLVAAPTGGSPRATEDSLDARFVTLDEADRLPLRGPDVMRYLEHVARGGRILPLDAIAAEEDPILLRGERE